MQVCLETLQICVLIRHGEYWRTCCAMRGSGSSPQDKVLNAKLYSGQSFIEYRSGPTNSLYCFAMANGGRPCSASATVCLQSRSYHEIDHLVLGQANCDEGAVFGYLAKKTAWMDCTSVTASRLGKAQGEGKKGFCGRTQPISRCK